jgi:hypothetical protein
MGDIRKQSIGPQFLNALTNIELQQQAAVLVTALEKLPSGSPERPLLGANLSLLEELATLRGVELPSVTAHTLRSVIAPLESDLRQLKATLKTVGDTQITFPGTQFKDVFKDELTWGDEQLDWMLNALTEATKLISVAEAGGPQSSDQFRQAGTRYTAALFGAQSVSIWMTYLQTAATAFSYAVPMSKERVIVALHGLRGKLRATLGDLRSVDPQRVEDAAARLPTEAKPFESDYKTFVAAFDKAAQNYQKFMAFVAAYEIVIGVIAGIRMTAGGGGAAGAAPLVMRLPGIGGITGGAAVGAGLVVSAEWLEMIRRLGKIGAISIGMAGSTVGVAFPGQLPAAAAGPTVLLRSTPGGSVTPSKGPDAGRAVSYGDTRHKHTKLANHTLDELKGAMTNPTGAPPDLQALPQNKGTPGWGSQLSKEATDGYAQLVKDALENGTRTGASRIDHAASYEVGIDIITGQATKRYRMFYSNAYGGWHLFPVL